jgi:CubicO group peptidase (beta-lactamase class C family)
MVDYTNLGDIADGRRLLVADFRGIGRSQLLFNVASDRNWWLGTFDGGTQAFSWMLAGHTSGFGDLRAGQMFWTGRFAPAPRRDQVLFYHPGDQNWWLGTFDDSLARLQWVSAGNTSGFGNLLAGQKFWTGRFSVDDRDQVLFYHPADQNWWLGTAGVGGRLAWSSAGNTAGFGNLLNGHKFWIGRFSRSDRDQVLMYYPGDRNWWLGSHDVATNKLVWSSAGNTNGFGNLLAGHMFWTGRFTRSDRTEVLFYYPGDQNWWVGSHAATTGQLAWTRVGITNGFGNLLAGHKFWTGRFASPDRDSVLFYYPANGDWEMSRHATGPSRFEWRSVATTDKLGDGARSLTGSFSRSDRTEVLVRDADARRWWLASVNDDWGGFRWRMALNTDQPRSGTASTMLRSRLREVYGSTLAGCVFYVTRDGRPFADGSFGHARRPGAADGELAMTASTLVHVGSITKFLCAVAILRLIEEWNRIVGRPASPHDATFARTVHRFGTPLSLDSKAFPLVQPYLDQAMIATYASFPGTNVANITLRQLLDHTSGLPRIGAEVTRAAFEADLAGSTLNDIVFEPGDDGATRFNLAKFVTGLLKQNATFANVYNNDAYSVLSAVIEATTGTPYATWLKQHIFIESRFEDLAPKVSDPVRSARYYSFDGSRFLFGNHHPDYTRFSLAGGYYVSAAVFAEWVDAVMQRKAVGHGPILDNPQLLLSDRPGLGGYAVERFRGYTKNGGAGPGGGSTNASFVYLRGYGSERIFAFTEANTNVNADAVRDEGLAALAESLTRRPGLNAPPPAAAGLRQTVFWNDAAGGVSSASTDLPVSIQPIAVGGVTVNRTRLLGAGPLAGGRSMTDIVTAELRGSIRTASAGNHVFRLASDDGSQLWLNDELVADNQGDHGMRACETDGVWLEADRWYPLRVRWYNSGGGADLCLEWRTPGASSFAPVPVAYFSPDA